MNKKIKNIFIKNFTNLSLNQGINIITAIVVSCYYGGFGLAVALLISEFSSFIVHTILLSKSDVSK
jgi:hypothetical protein